MEPFLITVNLVLYQLIEHLDREGVSGNLLDLLHHLVAGRDLGPDAVATRFLRNQGLPGFLVPPEEQGRFRAFMRRLSACQAGDTSLGEILNTG